MSGIMPCPRIPGKPMLWSHVTLFTPTVLSMYEQPGAKKGEALKAVCAEEELQHHTGIHGSFRLAHPTPAWHAPSLPVSAGMKESLRLVILAAGRGSAVRAAAA